MAVWCNAFRMSQFVKTVLVTEIKATLPNPILLITPLPPYCLPWTRRLGPSHTIFPTPPPRIPRRMRPFQTVAAGAAMKPNLIHEVHHVATQVVDLKRLAVQRHVALRCSSMPQTPFRAWPAIDITHHRRIRLIKSIVDTGTLRVVAAPALRHRGTTPLLLHFSKGKPRTNQRWTVVCMPMGTCCHTISQPPGPRRVWLRATASSRMLCDDSIAEPRLHRIVNQLCHTSLFLLQSS